MWLLKEVLFLVLLGVFSWPQLSSSSDLAGSVGERCSDEKCGKRGAGHCIEAVQGYVCLCNSGFTALVSVDGPSCRSAVGAAEVQGEGQEEETTEGSSTESGVGQKEGTVEGSSTESGEGEKSETHVSAEGGEEFADAFDTTPTPENSGSQEEEQRRGPGLYDFLCESSPCGSPSSAKCLGTVDGYVCICNPGYTPASVEGRQACVWTGESLCAGSPCGPGHQCLQLESAYTCVCASGSHSTLQGNGSRPTCVPDVEDDVCGGNICGHPVAVQGCAVGADGSRQCTCHAHALLVEAPDGGQQCVGPYPMPIVSETEGSPYMPQDLWDSIKDSLPGKPTPSPSGSGSVVLEPEEQAIGGGAIGPSGEAEAGPFGIGEGAEPGSIGAPGEGPGSTGGAESEADGIGGIQNEPGSTEGPTAPEPGWHRPEGEVARTGEQTEENRASAGPATPGEGSQKANEEETGSNSLAIAGGVIGALILVAAAGGGAAIYNQKQGQDFGQGEVDFEQPVQEGVEVEADESEILINVSNSDWAS